MREEEIIKKVINIAETIKQFPENYYEDNFDKALTGAAFSYKPQEMVYLLLELQNEFGVHFSSSDVLNYQFNYLNSIVEMIKIHV